MTGKRGKTRYYAVECKTPYLWRELIRLVANSPIDRWGRYDSSTRLFIVTPTQRGGFLEVVKACEGVAEEV